MSCLAIFSYKIFVDECVDSGDSVRESFGSRSLCGKVGSCSLDFHMIFTHLRMDKCANVLDLLFKGIVVLNLLFNFFTRVNNSGVVPPP